MFSEAKKYHGYARECRRLAEAATSADQQAKLKELSRIWLEAALREERFAMERRSQSQSAPQTAPATA
jgi:hypothetical protein